MIAPRLLEQICGETTHLHRRYFHHDPHVGPGGPAGLNPGPPGDLGRAGDNRAADLPGYLRGQVDDQVLPGSIRYLPGHRLGRGLAWVLAQPVDGRPARCGRADLHGPDRDVGDPDLEFIVLGAAVADLDAARVADDDQGVSCYRFGRAAEGTASAG